MKEKANTLIDNMAAIPILYEENVVYIVAICNKRHTEIHSRFTSDELALA
jgi:hypothetical protein